MTFAAWVTETVDSPDALDGVDGALLAVGTSSIAELGATSAGAGATEVVDSAPVAAGADDATDDASDEGGATARGACDSTFGAGDSTFGVGVLAVVGDAGATAVTTGGVVVCVTSAGGGSTGSTGSTGSSAC